ncbi:MAG: hypothetical protein VX221_03130 [SAR324 cluster bacterium]|nr:hypothetical protein [SAR324 cluster bacterium]
MMTVAETIFKAIKIREIDFVFCVPGESFLATMDSFLRIASTSFGFCKT